MNDVRSEDLSALIDGELEAHRAAQVRNAVTADPALRADYEALLRLDAGLRGIADATAFMPDITLPASPAASRPAREWGLLPAGAVALLLIRLAPKFIDMAALGWMLQIIAVTAILLLVARLAMEQEPRGAAPV